MQTNKKWNVCDHCIAGKLIFYELFEPIIPPVSIVKINYYSALISLNATKLKAHTKNLLLLFRMSEMSDASSARCFQTLHSHMHNLRTKMHKSQVVVIIIIIYF